MSYRRLNTLNKCASMKLDVSHPKKKVRYFFSPLRHHHLNKFLLLLMMFATSSDDDTDDTVLTALDPFALILCEQLANAG